MSIHHSVLFFPTRDKIWSQPTPDFQIHLKKEATHVVAEVSLSCFPLPSLLSAHNHIPFCFSSKPMFLVFGATDRLVNAKASVFAVSGATIFPWHAGIKYNLCKHLNWRAHPSPLLTLLSSCHCTPASTLKGFTGH